MYIDMGYIYMIFILLLSIPYIILFIILIMVMNKLSKEMQYKREYDERIFNLNFNLNNDDIKLLDNLIKEELEKYIIINFEHNPNLYIKEKEQNKMIKELLKQTLYKLSPILKNKLEYVYNKEVVEDIILEKIKFSTMEYVISVNGEYVDDDTP